MTIDVVDVTDPDLQDKEVKHLGDTGQIPITVSGQSNAVDYVVEQILAVSRGRNIGLLRFHGHGLPGFQSLSGFTPSMTYEKVETLLASTAIRSGIGIQNFDAIEPSLKRLTSCFHAGAQVWLMGCDVGNGEKGFALLESLATLWNVPTKAGVGLQYGNNPIETFGLEGQTITVDPRPRDPNGSRSAEKAEIVHVPKRVQAD